MSNEELVKIFLNWLKAGSTGCMFARHLAINYADSKWTNTIVHERAAQGLGTMMNKFLLKSLQDKDDVHQFHFPAITSVAHVPELLNAISESDRWKLTQVPIEEECQSISVALRWFPPNQDFVNWVIGFAPFETMPPTRRSPGVSLLIRTGSPSTTAGIAKGITEQGAPNPDEVAERKIDFGRTPVHVADVPSLLTDSERIAKYWQASKELTGKRLGGFQPAGVAKAKMTFVIPTELKGEISGI